MSDKDFEFEYEDEYEDQPRHSSGGRHVKPRSSHARPAAARSGRTGGGEDRPARSRPEAGRSAPPPSGGRPRKKKKKTGKIVLIVALALVLILALAAFLVFNHFYGLINGGTRKNAPTPTPAAVTEVTPGPTEEPTPTPTPTPRPLTEEELREQEEMKLRSELQEDAEEIMFSDNVYNILLVGADGRSEEIERSDAMILLSINKESKTIWLTSLMRDTLVNIDGWYQPHLNWATSLGGIDLLIDTIESEKNFAIHIDNWALVNFIDFVEIADMMGSITVTLSDKEIAELNSAIREIARMMERERTYVYGAGEHELTNGMQILAYCRERHITGDTGRSEKQRNALVQLWNNVKQLPLKDQIALVEKVMSIIHTDLTRGQCASLLLSAPSFINYEIKTQQCPVPGAFWKGRDDAGLSAYYADFKVNRNFLRATIYNEPMTAADLTSSWTGAPVLVMEPTA